MKVIRADRMAGPLHPALAAAIADPEAVPLDLLRLQLIADSAIGRNNHPVFLPDFITADPGAWVVEVMPAVQIGRLGKFIRPKFAARHISAILLAGWVRPATADTATPITLLFDGALTRGVEMPLNEIFPADSLPADSLPADSADSCDEISGNALLQIEAEYSPIRDASGENTKRESASMAREQIHAEDMVAFVSRFCTLKSGDIIIPASAGITFPVALDMRLRATLNGINALELRLK